MRRLLLFLLLTAPLAALTPEQWQADLAFLAKELPARHINAFATLSRADFNTKVRDLNSRIPRLPEASIRAGILKIVASIGDGHTNAQVWGPGSGSPMLPLGLYWFQDGIFAVAVTESNRNLLGAKLLRVGKLNVEDVARQLGAYVSHENEAQLKAQVPSLMMHPDLLREIGAADSADSIPMEFQPVARNRNAVEVKPVVFQEKPKWIWAYTGVQPLYQQDRSIPYFATALAGGTIYFRYNSCVNDPRKPFSKFVEDLKNTLGRPGVNRLIIDLRNNGGGNSAILDPFIGWLKTSPLNRKSRLFVLIGRPTFSSAILNAVRLKNDTAAILVGQATGGKPNHFGEVQTFALPNSHIVVSYSTKHFQQSRTDTPSLNPDILVEPSSRDYLAGADPVLDKVLQQPVN
jgi:hypothetical protein